MIARGLRPMIWAAGVGASVLGLYMVSLKVAAERAELTALEQRIAQTRNSIRSLQTELGTRGRLQQLEQWNSEVLALSTPAAGQFLDSNVSLARFDLEPRTTPVAAPPRLASSPAAPAVALAHVRQLSVPATAPVTPALIQASVAPQSNPQQESESPAVRTALLATARRPAIEARPARAEPNAAPVTRAAATQRGPGLLDEATLRDLSMRSRGERDGGARN
ncbi:MAG: hypothetical protein ACT4OE_07585 [Sphingosinicella sp.]